MQLWNRSDDLIPEESDVVLLALKRLSEKESYDRVFRLRRAVQVWANNISARESPQLTILVLCHTDASAKESADQAWGCTMIFSTMHRKLANSWITGLSLPYSYHQTNRGWKQRESWFGVFDHQQEVNVPLRKEEYCTIWVEMRNHWLKVRAGTTHVLYSSSSSIRRIHCWNYDHEALRYSVAAIYVTSLRTNHDRVICQSPI
jgi:hypothetical protein